MASVIVTIATFITRLQVIALRVRAIAAGDGQRLAGDCVARSLERHDPERIRSSEHGRWSKAVDR